MVERSVLGILLFLDNLGVFDKRRIQSETRENEHLCTCEERTDFGVRYWPASG